MRFSTALAGGLAAIILPAAPAFAEPQLPAPTSPPAISVLGALDLGKEYPGMTGQRLLLRTVVLAPGAGLPLHGHKGRPEIFHVVSGVVTEQRNGRPIVQEGPGATVINDGSVSHTLVNLGTTPAQIVVASIAPAAPPSAPPPPRP